jgi:hypothetical protein
MQSLATWTNESIFTKYKTTVTLYEDWRSIASSSSIYTSRVCMGAPVSWLDLGNHGRTWASIAWFYTGFFFTTWKFIPNHSDELRLFRPTQFYRSIYRPFLINLYSTFSKNWGCRTPHTPLLGTRLAQTLFIPLPSSITISLLVQKYCENSKANKKQYGDSISCKIFFSLPVNSIGRY